MEKSNDGNMPQIVKLDNAYSNIDYSDMNLDSLVLEEQPVVPPESEKPAEEKPKAPGEEKPVVEGEEKLPEDTLETVTVDGADYSVQEIHEALKISKNQKDFNTSNTQKAQKTSEMRKAIEPIHNLYSKLIADGDTFEEAKEALSDLYGEEIIEMMDDVKSFDPEKYKHPDIASKDEEIDKLKQESAGDKAYTQFFEERDGLMEKFGLTFSKASRVKDKTLEIFKETGEAKPLEEIYQLYFLIPDQQKEIDKLKVTPHPPTSIETVAANEIKEVKKVKNVKDLSPEEILRGIEV